MSEANITLTLEFVERPSLALLNLFYGDDFLDVLGLDLWDWMDLEVAAAEVVVADSMLDFQEVLGRPLTRSTWLLAFEGMRRLLRAYNAGDLEWTALVKEEVDGIVDQR